MMQPQRSYVQRLRISKPRHVAKKTLSYMADGLVFFLGLLTPFSVQIVGQLPLSEFLLIPLFPVLLSTRRNRVLNPRMNRIYILIGIWLLGQIASDIFRNSPQESWMRGLAAIAFFFVDIICMVILVQGKPIRQILFIIGLSIGTIVVTRVQPSDIAREDPWKFGYSASIAYLLLTVACAFYKRKNYAVVGVIISTLIVLNLLFNFRSAVFFLLVLSVLILQIIPERIGRIRLLPRQKSMGRVLVLSGLALIAGVVTVSLISFASQSGLAGEEAQEKNLRQLNSKQGLLLSGRPEILVSSQAVLDSPILGHGSEAKDPKYVEMLYDITVENGGWMGLEDIQEQSHGTIPTHSHLMAAWVQAGICGAIFWFYMWALAFRAIVVVSLHRPPLAPVYGWIIIMLLWNIPFSPFGSFVRINEALAIVIVVDLLASAKSILGTGETAGLKWRRAVRTRERISSVAGASYSLDAGGV